MARYMGREVTVDSEVPVRDEYVLVTNKTQGTMRVKKGALIFTAEEKAKLLKAAQAHLEDSYRVETAELKALREKEKKVQDDADKLRIENERRAFEGLPENMAEPTNAQKEEQKKDHKVNPNMTPNKGDVNQSPPKSDFKAETKPGFHPPVKAGPI